MNKRKEAEEKGFFSKLALAIFCNLAPLNVEKIPSSLNTIS